MNLFRNLKPLFVLFLVVLFSESSFAQCDNLKPMFGDNCTKNAGLQKADQKFRKTATKQFGSPDSAARAYLQMGWEYFRKKDEATAMKRFNQAWLLNPQNPAVYFAFGHLVRYAFARNAADAERYYKQGQLLDKQNAAEFKSLLTVLAALDFRDDREAVVDASSQLIVKDPAFGNGYGYKKRAYYYTRLQMPDRAILDYEKALEIDPKDANTYLGRGYAYSWQRKHQQAIADYSQAITLAPNHSEAYINRAVLYADSLNQPAQALPD